MYEQDNVIENVAGFFIGLMLCALIVWAFVHFMPPLEAGSTQPCSTVDLETVKTHDACYRMDGTHIYFEVIN